MKLADAPAAQFTEISGLDLADAEMRFRLQLAVNLLDLNGPR